MFTTASPITRPEDTGAPAAPTHTAEINPAQLPLDARLQVAQSLLPIVTQSFGVTVAEVCKRTRGKAKTAFARQVAMYLANTMCGLTFTDVGRLFGRDRTTVSHGCALVEEYRDDPTFDQIIDILEVAVRARLAMAIDPPRPFVMEHTADNDDAATPTPSTVN